MEERNEDKAETKVRFVGDPSNDFNGPSSMSMFGMEFPKGEYVVVSDPNVVRKLRGHSHFQFEGDEAPEAVNNAVDDLAQIGAGTGGLDRLKEVAAAEGVEYDEDGITKAKLMKAIRGHRQRQGNDD